MPTSPTTRQDIAEVLCKTLKINEIFYSLQGETRFVGLPTIFIRLTGCPLRCHYCDTAYAFHAGQRMTLENILQAINQYRTRYVTVTGGEPLAQKYCHDLLALLCDEGYVVSLETSGAMAIDKLDERVCRIVDIKTPGSGEMEKNLMSNLAHLNNNDQIKFVLVDKADYEWSKNLIREHQLNERCEVLLSPAHGSIKPVEVADWILDDQLPVRLQIQLHKFLWGDIPGK